MSLPSIPFWFIRHGQTDYNLAGLAQGVLDVDLNETGRLQAERAAPLLAGQGITAIISSPMRRAAQTSAIINEVLHLKLHYEADLREVSFGEAEGKSPDPWFPSWVAGHYTPDKGESFDELASRVGAVLGRVLPAHQGPLLIVAHGGVLRAIRALMCLPKEVSTGNALPLYCAPTEQGWQVTQAQDL